MLNILSLICFGVSITAITSEGSVKSRYAFVLDQRFVCNIKRSCVECLRLSHCSWCEADSRCFSKLLPLSQDYCKNDTIVYTDNGFSLQENAECSCGSSNIKENCVPPDAADGEACSGRGTCVCGRCICDPNPDPDHPTKTIVGEYCEFDNFSCDGRHCNEGPYPLSQAVTNEESSDGVTEVEQPSEI